MSRRSAKPAELEHLSLEGDQMDYTLRCIAEAITAGLDVAAIAKSDQQQDLAVLLGKLRSAQITLDCAVDMARRERKEAAHG